MALILSLISIMFLIREEIPSTDELMRQVEANYEEAIRDSKAGLEQNSEDDSRTLVYHMKLGLAYEGTGEYDESIYHAERVLEFSVGPEFKSYGALSHRLIGLCSYNIGTYDRALTHFNQALRMFQEMEDQQSISNLFNNIANVHYMRGAYPPALENYLSSLAIREKLGDKGLISDSLNNIALVYKFLGNRQQALRYFERCLEIEEELNRQPWIADALNNIGSVHYDNEDYAKALAYFRRSLEIEKVLDSKEGLSYTLNDIGTVLIELGQYEEAESYLKQALDIREKLKDNSLIANTLLSLGDLYHRLKRHQEAERILLRGIDICKVSDFKPLLLSFHHTLSRNYESMGDYTQALIHYKVYKETNDFIFNKEKNKRLAAMQARFESEQKEKEIKLLKENAALSEMALKRQANLRNALLAAGVLLIIAGLLFFRQRVQSLRLVEERRINNLKDSHLRDLDQKVAEATRELKERNEELREKNAAILETRNQLVIQEKMASLGTLTAGIAHELRNPLNFINNFSHVSLEICQELAQEAEDSKSMDDLREDLKDLLRNNESIARHGERATHILECMMELLPSGRTQRQSVELNKVLEDFATMALQSHPARSRHEVFDLKISFELDSQIGSFQLIPKEFGRAIINLTNNAIEALYPSMEPPVSEPSLTITSKEFKDHIVISVSDNGPGIPDSELDRVFDPFFSTKPTGDGNIGLGLAICYDVIVGQHGGRIEVDTQPGSYTKVICTLPKTLPSLGET